MILNGFWEVFLAGLFGGVLGELMKWYRLRTSNNLPTYLKSFFYWLITMLIIISGGVLTILYGTFDVNAILAVNIGLSSPLIIQTLAKNNIGDLNKRYKTDSTSLYDDKSLKERLSKGKSILNFLSGE